MKTVPVSDMIALFQTMYREHWPYVWGKAEKGCVDCSGAFTYAFEQFVIACPHGSNAMARSFTVGHMLPISEAKPGMAAFKVRVPGEKDYDLKDKYKSGTDLNDYYHVGMVDEDPRYVLNAKGKDYGFCRDKLSRENGWDCVAYLKHVDYGEEKTDMGEKAVVVLASGSSGSTVNLREAPGKNHNIIVKVPVGAEVTVEEDRGAWCKVMYGDRTGWMMSNYLEYSGQDGETDDITAEGRQQIEEALKMLDHAKEMIEQAVDMIGSVVGRG